MQRTKENELQAASRLADAVSAFLESHDEIMEYTDIVHYSNRKEVIEALKHYDEVRTSPGAPERV